MILGCAERVQREVGGSLSLVAIANAIKPRIEVINPITIRNIINHIDALKHDLQFKREVNSRLRHDIQFKTCAFRASKLCAYKLKRDYKLLCNHLFKPREGSHAFISNHYFVIGVLSN